jgi:hypothetical protein
MLLLPAGTTVATRLPAPDQVSYVQTVPLNLPTMHFPVPVQVQGLGLPQGLALPTGAVPVLGVPVAASVQVPQSVVGQTTLPAAAPVQQVVVTPNSAQQLPWAGPRRELSHVEKLQAAAKDVNNCFSSKLKGLSPKTGSTP